MRRDKLETFERRALEVAGDNAGAYLDGIAKTDLGGLSEAEWHEFLSQVILGFGDAMRAQLWGKGIPKPQ